MAGMFDAFEAALSDVQAKKDIVIAAQAALDSATAAAKAVLDKATADYNVSLQAAIDLRAKINDSLVTVFGPNTSNVRVSG